MLDMLQSFSSTLHFRRAKLFKNEIGVENPMVKSVPGNVYMPKKFTLVAKALYNMEVRPDDIWIVTYPKCGTTLTQVTRHFHL